MSGMWTCLSSLLYSGDSGSINWLVSENWLKDYASDSSQTSVYWNQGFVFCIFKPRDLFQGYHDHLANARILFGSDYPDYFVCFVAYYSNHMYLSLVVN